MLIKSKRQVFALIIVMCIGAILCLVGVIGALCGNFALIVFLVIGLLVFMFGVYFFVRVYANYKDLINANKIINAVGEQKEKTIEEIATICNFDLTTTRKYVSLCFKKNMLEGYTRVGEKIVSNAIANDFGKKITYVKCKSCGALTACKGNETYFCEYCGSLVQNE